MGALSRNLVLCHFSCRFYDTEPGSIHKNPGRFPCIISLCIRWHVRRHDTGGKKVNLAELLPDGLKLTTGSSTDLWITVNILPEGSKIYNFPTEDIKVKGLPDNLQLAFEVADVELKVQAEDGDLSGFNLKSISATLSMDDWEEGSYEVPIKISLPDGYKLLEDVTAEIKISKVSNVDSGNSQ